MSGQEYRSVFAKKLKFYMDLKGKKQSDLVNDLGYSTSAVSSWCVGSRIPRPEIIDELAKYFDVKRSDLLEYKKEDDEVGSIGNDGLKVLRAYNNNSKIKILFDYTHDLSDDDAQMLIDIIERMKKTR